MFDIDGTLIDAGGAGGGALLLALSSEFGIAEVQPVMLHGRTDLGILTELLESNGILPSPQNLERLGSRYLELLPGELEQRRGNVLPGVPRLLATLRSEISCHMGLLTGNMPSSARVKLDHFGLWQFFDFGIFGDQTHHRPLLCEPALAAVRRHSGRVLEGERIVIVGDTPLDIELAIAMGARVLAVCTGGFDRASLLAAGATQVLEDLSNTELILDWFFNYTEL